MEEPRPGYPSLILEGTPEDLDAAAELLFEAGCLGTEETDGQGGVRRRQTAFFPPGTDVERVGRRLANQTPSLRCGPVELVPDRDWSSLWKQGYHGFELGQRFYILPSWQPPPQTDRIVLRIDPERAFGTGTHDSTRLCLELIEQHAARGLTAIDAGTGTGILAMAAAALGCRAVLAIENDPDAALCARLNVHANGYADTIDIVTSCLSEVRPSSADLVIANLNEPILSREIARLAGWLRPGGVVILSGLLDDQTGALIGRLPASLVLLEQKASGGWGALSARRVE